MILLQSLLIALWVVTGAVSAVFMIKYLGDEGFRVKDIQWLIAGAICGFITDFVALILLSILLSELWEANNSNFKKRWKNFMNKKIF